MSSDKSSSEESAGETDSEDEIRRRTRTPKKRPRYEVNTAHKSELLQTQDKTAALQYESLDDEEKGEVMRADDEEKERKLQDRQKALIMAGLTV